MRFPHRLARSSPQIGRGAHSSHKKSLGRGALDRLAIGQTHLASTLTSAGDLPLTPPRHHDRRSCIRAGWPANRYDDDARFINILDRTIDVGWMMKGGRAFGSTDSHHDDNAEASDEKNRNIISHAELGEIAKAKDLLDQMQAHAMTRNNADGLPDIDSYTALVNALVDEQKRLISIAEDEGDEAKVESDLNATLEKNDEHTSAQSNNERRAVAIMALAEKAQDLLIRMEDLSGVSDHYSSMRPSGTMSTELRNASLRPTSHHYDSVISAFANATTSAHNTNYTCPVTKDAPFIAQRWITRMETLAFDPHSGVTPTVDSYFHVMEACAASSETNNRQCKAPVLAQSIFDKLQANTNIYPTAREYRLMIRTWCNFRGGGYKEAAYRAMGFWMTMQREFRGGVEEMEPTLEDGKMVLEAWTRAVNKHTARRAQTVLTTMEKLHASKKTAVRPDLECYRYVFITMSRSRVPTVGSNIPELLKSMEDNNIFPDTACFDAVIETLKNCARHSKSEDSEKYARATEGMLLRMERQRDRDSESVIEPSAVTYTNVIQALAELKTIKAAERADELLTKMETEYAATENEQGDESIRPTRDSYVGVIHAYGNSDAADKYLRADEVLQRMITQHSGGNEGARPCVGSFHAVIGACSRTADATPSPEKRKEALLLAVSTVQYMKKSESHRPNAKSYLLLLQCCANLLPAGSSEREKALRSIFRSCRKDGLVNRGVLKQFQSTVSAEAYHREVVRDAPTYDGVKSLPETWTRSLGYRPRTRSGTDGDGFVTQKRNPVISVRGEVIGSTAYNDHRMRRRWAKKGQKVLQGGRS